MERTYWITVSNLLSWSQMLDLFYLGYSDSLHETSSWWGKGSRSLLPPIRLRNSLGNIETSQGISGANLESWDSSCKVASSHPPWSEVPTSSDHPRVKSLPLFLPSTLEWSTCLEWSTNNIFVEWSHFLFLSPTLEWSTSFEWSTIIISFLISLPSLEAWGLLSPNLFIFF